MGFQCLPQIMGLVRGDGARKDGNGQSKHRANVAGMVHEAFEIKDPTDGHAIHVRKTRTETYDKTRTVNNEYVGYQTADDVLDAIEEEASKQKVDVRVKDKATGETVIRQRGLPSTAVIGVAVIFKPPCAVARDWTPEQYDQFIQDCEECMAQIPCVKMNKKGEPTGKPVYLFGRQNIIARATHWDEGEAVDPPVFAGHWHEVYKPEDQYGKYNGNLIDAMFLSEQVNKLFPQLMRERGWDIDDPEHTDWDKFSTDRKYRSTRKNKLKKSGKSVNDYISAKRQEAADAQVEEAASMVEQAAALVKAADLKTQEAEARVLEAEAAKRQAIADRAQAEKDRDKAIAERDEAVSQRDQAVESKRLAVADKDKAIEDKAQAETDRDAAFQEQQRLQMGNTMLGNMQTSAREEYADLAAELDAVKSQTAAAVRDRDAARKEADDLRKNQIAAAKKAAAEAAESERARIVAEIRSEVTREAEADRDAARAEAEELRRTKVEQAEKAAAARQKELDDAIMDARDKLEQLQEKVRDIQDWIDDKIQKAESKAKRIVEAATKTAESIRAAATGEHAFLIDYFGKEPFIVKKEGPYKGKSWLDVARSHYEAKIRKERLADMPASVRDAGKSQPTGTGPSGPGGT